MFKYYVTYAVLQFIFRGISWSIQAYGKDTAFNYLQIKIIYFLLLIFYHGAEFPETRIV